VLAIRGFGSPLAQLFLDFLPPWETAVPVERGACDTQSERHLFCQGVLTPQHIGAQAPDVIADSFMANCASTIRQCDMIVGTNDNARILVMGSESGFAWSYDGVYAASKAGLHKYVETKKLRTPDQQLVCIAPSIISNGGMTLRRTDEKNLAKREAEHPKKRFLTCSEVCALMKYLLYIDTGYLTGTVIRLNGGAHT
jgi:NAD(P)-dependent dehydrogenase (short-subunit alcohol dehydrogenase family)